MDSVGFLFPKTVVIDLEKHATGSRSALKLAFRFRPDRIVFIGSDSDLECMACETGYEIEVLPAGSEVPTDALEILPLNAPGQSTEEIDLFADLLARAQAGETIHVQGPISGTLAMKHIATIERLKREAGRAVCVMYS